MYWFGFIAAAAAVYFFYNASKRHRLLARIKNTPFPSEWREILIKEVPFYNALEQQDKNRLEQNIQYFIYTTRITAIQSKLTEELKVLVAASACIPVFGIANWSYDNLGEVLLFPAKLENHLVEFEGEGAVLGRVQPYKNSYILSLSEPALRQGFKNIQDKHNVGIHEFAHIIDQMDGSIDGTPETILPSELVPTWKNLVHQEIKKIKAKASDINSYGATNEAEFFAVATEYFFEDPLKFKKRHPAIFEVLEKTFHQDLDNKSYFNTDRYLHPFGAKISRNAPCPCGSKKKYKNCCLKD